MLHDETIDGELVSSSEDYYRNPQTLERAVAYIRSLEAKIAVMHQHSRAATLAMITE